VNDANKRPGWTEGVAIFVAVAITGLEVFITVAPYLGLPARTIDATLTIQQQTIIQNVFMVIVGYLFGSSVGSRFKDNTINTLAPGAGGVPKSALDPPAVPPDPAS
jgi:hypothetical protein